MSTKHVHTLEESRKIINRNFDIFKDVLGGISFDRIIKETNPLSDSKAYLKNLISQLDNPDLKYNNLMQEAGKLLKNNDKLTSLIMKGDMNFDNLMKEGVKLLEENKNIQQMVDEIANNEEVKTEYHKIKAEEIKTNEMKTNENKFKIIDEVQLNEFIEKTQITNPDFNMVDMTTNIYEFFNKYPTKEHLRFPDGTIINMAVNESAVDENLNILPLKNGIPQGEEATRIVTKNLDTGVVIASPPGVMRTYFITRYGTPKTYDYEIDKFEGLREVIGKDFSSNCFFEKFGCSGKVQPIISVDVDGDMNCCEKHHSISACMLNVNIATKNDIDQFYNDEMIKYLNQSSRNTDKVKLLKKVGIVMTLAESCRLKNRRIDEDFRFHGIHYYHQFSFDTKKRTSGWALVYYSLSGIKKKLCHIYMDELTDDQKVIGALCLMAQEVLNAKYYNDVDHIKNFIKNQKKLQFKNLERVFEKAYKLDMREFISHKLIT